MIYRFEHFQLDSAARELTAGGEVREVEPQVLSLLELLLSNHGKVVTKDEIVDHVWKGRIVSDGSINSRVKLLRKALDDDGKQQRLIKTHHGQGFRFVGDLAEEAGLQNAARSPAKEAEPPQPTKRSIAVLPFDNMSSDPEQEHFADGLCEEILTALSKIQQLQVVARNSSFQYKGRPVDIREVGRELNVAFVLEGSVRVRGSALRITAQLIDAHTGSHVWAESYDRACSDIFALQDEMTREIVSALQVELVDGEQAQLWAGGTTNLDAWQDTVRAYAELSLHSREALVSAQARLQAALRHDPDYASALTLLGRSYFFEAFNGWAENRLEALGKCYEASEKALDINPNDPQALAQKAMLAALGGRLEEASELCTQAISFGPSHAQTLTMAAMVMGFCKEYDLAEIYAKRARRANPTVRTGPASVLGTIYLAGAKNEAAMEEAKRIQQVDPENIDGFLIETAALFGMGNVAEARDCAARFMERFDDFSLSHFLKSRAYPTNERVEKALIDAGIRE